MHFRCLVYSTCLLLSACFWKKEEPVAPVLVKKVVPAKPATEKDQSLESLVRLFAFADGVHREAWWVLSEDKRPVGKSPFGKVQRALLASQNIKLTNKSMFRCDRYVVKRDILGLTGYPQRAEVFEKCSEKSEAKRLADLNVPKAGEVEVTFYPDNLEEILGISATVLNRKITCTLKGTEEGQLTSLKCKDWAQERSKEHMIRLDVYDYTKDGKNLIKLRGKVYEHLTDIRKIEADVPLEGKISVLETELYAPQDDTPVPAVKPANPTAGTPPAAAPHMPEAPPATGGVEGIPQSRSVDPDVMMQRQRSQDPNSMIDSADPHDPSNHGIPLDEAPEGVTVEGIPVNGENGGEGSVDADGNEVPLEQHPMEPQQQLPGVQGIPGTQGVPSGR